MQQKRMTTKISKTKGLGAGHAASSIIFFYSRSQTKKGFSLWFIFSSSFLGAEGIVRQHPSTPAGFLLAFALLRVHIKPIAFFGRVKNNRFGTTPHIIVIVIGKNTLNKPLLLEVIGGGLVESYLFIPTYTGIPLMSQFNSC